MLPLLSNEISISDLLASCGNFIPTSYLLNLVSATGALCISHSRYYEVNLTPQVVKKLHHFVKFVKCGFGFIPLLTALCSFILIRYFTKLYSPSVSPEGA
jgi:hypothetical protein